MKRVVFLLTSGLLLAAGGLYAAQRPVSHLIPNVPWHVQFNGLFCGDGSLESVFDYWGPDLNQKAIADVARSSSIGTWTFDLRRAGHFSCLSAAQGRFFPAEVPTAGFPERPLGYATFTHAAPTPWFDELKDLLAADIPVILIMTFSPEPGSGGHYRVAVGYDDLQGVIYFVDPWGRDMRYLPGTEGIIAWTYEEVASGWNYPEYGTPEPYWGVAILPWSVDVRTKGKLQVGSKVTVTAIVKYPCPAPFDPTEYPATNVTATIQVPAGVTLLSQPTVSLGIMAAGAAQTVSWKVEITEPLAGKTITVTAQGMISGSVPEALWTGQSQSYPPYDYTDLIGGSGEVHF